ncbi:MULTISPECIES: hypothetical protein [Methylomonas]|uniref:hypothetical protein n=1 Tax=Methylomonas TaxID=416 RepID=UPI0007C8C821|nr:MULTISPECIES: hypothetical protein [Methylomonas]ANE55720.1 hypothetical protein AYM39_11375 [Methylomonas sp. DH-1]WNB73883.1 hypothetical protein RI210_11345 [Methylomonas koyamae]
MKIKTDFLLPALVLCSGNSYALDLLFEPDFSFKERYDDNLRLQPDPIRDNWVSTLSPALTSGYISENNDLTTKFRWNELIYHGESSLNFSEKLANLNHQFRHELFKTDFGASYLEQSSLSTQLDETGSGNLRTQVPRISKSLSPSFTYFLTEKNSLQLSYNLTDVKFDRPENIASSNAFSDYKNQQFSAIATHAYSQRLSFNLIGSYSKFDSISDISGFGTVRKVAGFDVIPFLSKGTTTYNQNSATLNYQAGLQYAFSEQLQLSFSAGIRNTDTETVGHTIFNNPLFQSTEFSQNSRTSGHVFSANLTQKSEWGSINLNAGQQLNPASSGTQQTSTTFSAAANYNLSERWSTGINANYLIAETVSTFGDISSSNNRTYAAISPNIRWQWTPEINLDFSYSYRQQYFESNNQTAIGNSVQFQFSYQPQINRQVK